ncbi:Protoporphyrinogen oxidase [Fuerstiella marisgermanici]|uniref:Coproporphyrinogen III oxidase n=2 Tax=Fuerstiella marisgermanici TaxID=1891926 RepID=A0A1P8WI87_9PLAN|nr:Protoporphyrinogen oxidase [Fuerstiella marisgermanici]
MNGQRVAVIGGGITGLACAHRLISIDPDVQVTIFEGSDRLGGIIQTVQQDGFLIELGPDSFITNKPGGVQLCDEIGFSDQLIATDETYRRSLVLRKGRPLPVPDGFMLMAPANPVAIMTTPILSAKGKLRLLQEAITAAKTTDEDESLASFVRRRFGTEALERLVQPLVGGIYTADPEKLSLKATLPRFLDMERQHGSVIRATLAGQKTKSDDQNSRAKAAASGSGARYGLFTTPADGLSSLVTAVEQKLLASNRVTINTERAVVSMHRIDNRWRLQPDGAASCDFDGVAMTLPCHKAAALLDDSATELATTLREYEYASSAIVVSGHRIADFTHPLDAFGLVIPAIENRKILAVSFTSRKFPGRAPEGQVLLRTFVGGAMQPELLQLTDDEIMSIVQQELTSILGLKSAPAFQQIIRYNNSMPQYHVGHLDLVGRTETLVGDVPGLELAGSAYHGVGIPDSIASGRRAAECLLASQKST